MEENYNIFPVNPDTFEYQEYSQVDENLIPTQSLDTAFTQSTDTIEFYIYDDNQNLIYPVTDDITFTSYSVREGDIILDPPKNLKSEGYYEGDYFAYYTFFRNKIGSSISSRYYISKVSSDRTEIILESNQIPDLDIINSVNSFILYRESKDYFVDFQLNFGINRQVIANNIQLDDSNLDSPKVLIKLYDPLPNQFKVKDTLWVIEEVSTPQSYRVEFPFQEVQGPSVTGIKGPNFSIDVASRVGQSSETFNYNQLVSTTQTSSLQQLQSLLQEKGIQINVNYEERSQYIKLSSAKSRLENFYYKASLIEDTQNKLSSSIYNITGSTTSSTSFSSSKASLESIIDATIENLDGYEYFLYYNSGSDFSWPKTSSKLPYKLYPTGSPEVLSWYGSDNEYSSVYGGQILSASLYDENNPDWIYRTIPEYLVEDSDNKQYEVFLDMIGQHFDNIWLYTKDVTNRFSADNRLDYGISKDLVADAIKDFGINLYSANYDKNDLYEAFLGIKSDGDSFLVSNITSSLPIPTGSGLQYINTKVTSSDSIVSLDDTQKSIYKRLYHNIPFLLKAKGTHEGLRVLLNSFGVPETILDSQEYGGSEKVHNAYDDILEIYNYALKFSGTQTVVTDWGLNTDWSASFDVPDSMFVRFQAETLHSSSTGPTNNEQTIFSLDTGTTLGIEYTGSSGIIAPYSGAIVNPEYQYAKLILYPNGVAGESGSVYLPFLNGDWFSAMINLKSGSMELYAGSKSSPYQTTQQVGYFGSASIVTDGSDWISGSTATFGDGGGAPFTVFSGSMQEIRYYAVTKSVASFNSYIMNPTNFEGQTDDSSADELAFRATLGTELYTGSLSVHPKISGSWLA